jgi:RNA polymerase-binding transcription factor DksA
MQCGFLENHDYGMCETCGMTGGRMRLRNATRRVHI